MLFLSRSIRFPVVLSALLLCGGVITAAAQVQTRPRVVKTTSVRESSAPPAAVPNQTQSTSRPVTAQRPPLVQKIVLSRPSDQPTATLPSVAPRKTESMARKPMISSVFDQRLFNGIQSRLGLRYVYGSEGPYTYDCSGFVWSVFREAGIPWERTSARALWNDFEPVATEDEKYEFGTLVFFNRLGHMGIVADRNGFYHASSSKGITYSPFAGYWEKRIVGFRKAPKLQ